MQQTPTETARIFNRLKNLSRLEAVTLALWIVVLLVICIRVALSTRNNSFTVYLLGGTRWIESKTLYSGHRGFVYSPLVAAFFAPFSLLPAALANILWRLASVAVFFGAVWWWLREGLHRHITRERFGVVFLLLLPMSLGNFNNGQANPFVISLLLAALVAVKTDRWNLAALCIALATYFKIYPLAAGMLLVLVHPKKFGWRLLVALAALGALSFVLQRPAYVWEQYARWFATRSADNRLQYGSDVATHDLWVLLRSLHVVIGERAYRFAQLGGAVAVAAVCLAGRLRRWPQERLLVALMTLVCCWMILLGPATESATYVLLAPAVVFALVQSFAQPTPAWMRALVTASIAVLLAGHALNSFIKLHDNFLRLTLEPFGALLFSVFAVAWILKPSLWASADRV